MLIGQYETTITEAKRVAIPKKFRSELGSNFIIARWYEKCLVLVAKNNWTSLMERVTGTNAPVIAPVRRTDRFILGSAFELTPDSQGRAVLPTSLVEYAGLKVEVVFVGLGDRVEIWDKTHWEKEESELANIAGDLIENLNNGQRP